MTTLRGVSCFVTSSLRPWKLARCQGSARTSSDVWLRARRSQAAHERDRRLQKHAARAAGAHTRSAREALASRSCSAGAQRRGPAAAAGCSGATSAAGATLGARTACCALAAPLRCTLYATCATQAVPFAMPNASSCMSVHACWRIIATIRCARAIYLARPHTLWMHHVSQCHPLSCADMLELISSASLAARWLTVPQSRQRRRRLGSCGGGWAR